MPDSPHQSFARRATESLAYRWTQRQAERLCRAHVVGHTLPDQARAGEICGARVELENAGSSPWCAESERAIQLHISIDDELVAALPLPLAEVGRGARVTFHFALAMPRRPGAYRLRATLAIPSVPFAAPLAGLDIALNVDCGADPTNGAFETMIRHNLWHYLPTSGIARSRRGHQSRSSLRKPEGPSWDMEGHRFIDYTMAWGAADSWPCREPRIQQAIRDALVTAPLCAVSPSDRNGRDADAAGGFRRRVRPVWQERIGCLHRGGAAGPPRDRPSHHSFLRIPWLAGLFARPSRFRRNGRAGHRHVPQIRVQRSEIVPRVVRPSSR